MDSLKWILVCILVVLVLGACHSKPKVQSDAIQTKTGNQRDGLDIDRDTGEEIKPIVQNIDGDTLHRQIDSLLPVFFDFDRYEIREDQIVVLQSDADLLRNSPDLHVLIEGHCDERGTEEYNLALGDRRAAVTRTYLMGLGIAAGRMRLISFGESHPAIFGHNEKAWSENRRAEFVKD